MLNKLLSNVFVVVICFVQLPEVFLDLLVESFGELVIGLLPLDQALNVEKRSFVDVARKEACFTHAIFKDHEANTVLSAIFPVTSIDATVSPEHLTVACFLVFFVVASILTSRGPDELSVTMLHVIFVLACILIVIFFPTFLPRSLSTLDPIEKLSTVEVVIFPSILPISIGFSENIFTNILIPDLKHITPLSMPQTVLPLPLIVIAITPYMLPEPIGLILNPVANVLI
jgi:hypothetical protein